ncbi:MAG: hypothetical protein ABI945_11595 [Nitrospirales bacterium]
MPTDHRGAHVGNGARRLPGLYSDSGMAMTEDQFRAMWTIYARCLNSSDLEVLRVDADRLHHAAQASAPGVETGRFSAPPPLRLSVDPAAMSAACAVHAGHMAMSQGHPSSARQLFRSVVSVYSASQYAYYAEQARAGLLRLESLTDSLAGLRLVSAP